MTFAKSLILPTVIAAMAAPLVYWSLLALSDSLTGSSQLYTQALYESRRALLMELIRTSCWLMLVYTPVLLCFFFLHMRAKVSNLRYTTLVLLAGAGVIAGLLTLIGFRISQSLLFIAAGIADLAIATAIHRILANRLKSGAK
jgi:uncharacterized membrane protein